MDSIMQFIGLLIQFMTFLVLLASLIIAVYSLKQYRKLTTQKTLEMIHKYNDDERVTAGWQVILDYKKGETNLEEYLSKGSKKRNDFLYLMNLFEIFAIGIEEGIYDKKLALKNLHADITTAYDRDLVGHIRKDGKGAFIHMENMVKECEKY